jgi:hypothetical protein
MTIRQPTTAAISFSSIADALRCHTATVKVRVPGKARTVTRHGKKILIPGRPHVVKRHVTRCHTRMARRKITVIETRHGKPVKVTKIKWVPLLPHTVEQTTRRVGHGRSSTVSGYLELTDGVVLSGRVVQILAAPDNGLQQFVPMASVTTGSNGIWTAAVPSGPSRLIEAVFAGDSTTEPVTSAAVKLIVPARIAMSIRPRVLPWSNAITIRGRLQGGYVPPDGVALRLLIRYPDSPQPSLLLALRTNPQGGFAPRWSFHAGRGVASYPMWISTTATESDYPFAAASTRHIIVTFGRPTPHHRRRHRARRRRKR